ncbi:hypothetical protein [Streptomyces sp. NPDC007117]|uniref:tetratricopeptide repeat protein n=1 Tax=Streptomyces sp. NPDC007117 TaxID=3154314 RepID=UPI0033CAFBB2
MERRPNSRLHRLVQASGFSQAQLASEIRRVAAERGQVLACGQSSVSRWLSGTRPRPLAGTFLLEAITRRLERPVSAVDAGLTEADIPVSGTGLDLSGEADWAPALAALLRADLDPVRRRLLTAGTYSLTALTLPAALPTPAKPPDTTKASAADVPLRARVEQLDMMARQFADATKTLGGGPVRTALAGYLTDPVTGWLNAPAPWPLHRQLLIGAARLTLLLGTMTADDGHDALAQHYHHLSARMAAEAGDVGLYSISLRSMAAHAYDLGQRTPAVLHLSEHAADTARQAPRPVRAYAQAHLATAAAARNDRHTALAALAAAERFHEQADHVPGPFTAYPLAALHYQRAQTLTALGDAPGAIGAYTAALRLRPAAERHANALTRAHLAETLLAQGYLDAALAHWTRFLDEVPHLGSARATRRLTALRQLLTPHRCHRPATLLLERATTLR